MQGNNENSLKNNRQHPDWYISEWKLYLNRIIDNKLKNINIIMLVSDNLSDTSIIFIEEVKDLGSLPLCFVRDTILNF